MASFFWFGGTSHTLTSQIATSTGGNLVSDATISPSGVAGTIAGASLNPYCANSKAKNYDHTFTENTVDIQVNFFSTSTAANWGLREFVLIVHTCSQPDCATCIGPAANQCVTCSDTNKKMYDSTTGHGTCLCKF